MEVFYRFFLYWASDKPHCKFGDNPCKALQRSGSKPFLPRVQADRWLAVFVRYKRQHWPFQSSADHFSLLQLCSSYFFLAFGPYSCLPYYPCSQFLPSATEQLLLPPSPCLVIPDYFHPGSFLDQGPWFPSSQHGSHCWPALSCRGLAPEHGLSHVMIQESATDQTPSPPGNLRQIVTCLISGPTAPFILVFSPGYNHELDSPGK